jgi:lipopolysaccharide assembly protein B
VEALLWFLLPLAAASGWLAAKHGTRPGQHARTRSLPSEYIQGLNYLLAEQPDKALEIFIRLVEVDLDTFETHLALGNLFRRRGEVDRAIRIHSNLVNRPHLESTFKARALIELARDYLKAGLLDRAEALLHDVIPYGLQSREAYQHLRELYEQEKDWRSAIQAAINLQSQTGRSQANTIAHYYCELSEAAAAGGKIDSAIDLAQKALAQDPDCARANLLLGNYASGSGDYAGAIERYRNVHTQDPRLIPLTLEKLKLAYDKTEGARVYLDYLEELYRQTRSVPVLLFVIEKLHDYDEESRIDNLLDKAVTRSRVPLRLLREYLKRRFRRESEESLVGVAKALDTHVGERPDYVCSNCGLETKTMFWQCPGCHGWGTVKPAIDPA